jgi:hypothetical protein
MMGAALAAVSIGFSAYTPKHVDVVAGQTVRWTQDSVRRHTVTAADGSWDSGFLVSGATYERAFPERGTYGYYCRLHAGIVGEVQVHDVVLDPVTTPAAKGRPFPLHGRASASKVTITGSDGSHTEATVHEDGTFAATVTPRSTTTYSAGDSRPVTLRVLDRRVRVQAVRHGSRWSVVAVVSPATPHGTVVLQTYLPERFGWWPVRKRHLGHDSATTFHVSLRRRVFARVVYTLPDGATVLAVSRRFRLRG